MTERDAIKEVVEQSITTKVDIEVLRKWAKEQYSEASKPSNTTRDDKEYRAGRASAFAMVIMKLDEMEVSKESDK